MLENLKKLREEAGITQKGLADAIGVSQQSINKYENHNIEPDIETLMRIARFFNTSVDYVVGNTDIRRRIEVVYSYELNEAESRMLEGYRKLSQKQKQSIDFVIENYNERWFARVEKSALLLLEWYNSKKVWGCIYGIADKEQQPRRQASRSKV